jgi:hypothetical protein
MQYIYIGARARVCERERDPPVCEMHSDVPQRAIIYYVKSLRNVIDQLVDIAN